MDTELIYGLSALKLLGVEAYSTSARSGFHNTDELEDFVLTEGQAKVFAQLQDGKRLFLVVSEIVEAYEELRDDHAPDETYYTLSRQYDYPGKGVLPKGTHFTAEEKETLERLDPQADGLFKPEGVPIELADALIRIMDYCHMRGIDLGAAVIEKTEFNKQRELMHGKTF